MLSKPQLEDSTKLLTKAKVATKKRDRFDIDAKSREKLAVENGVNADKIGNANEIAEAHTRRWCRQATNGATLSNRTVK